MISPAIKHLIEQKSGSFLIPASKIAVLMDENPLYHAFLILTKVKYSKIPVINKDKQIVGLLSLAMITNKMITNNDIDLTILNKYQVKDVMETNFSKINFTEDTLERQLHLLVDNNFLPVVDDYDVFQGILTRREWIKAFNFVAHEIDNYYHIESIDKGVKHEF